MAVSNFLVLLTGVFSIFQIECLVLNLYAYGKFLSVICNNGKLYFIALIFMICVYQGFCTESEILLRNYLIESRKSLASVRPVVNDTNSVAVTLGVTLSQIINLDAKLQVLKLSIYLRQMWYNSYLKWNITRYNGLKSININPKDMWLPDITLYNSAYSGESGEIDTFSTRVIVDHTGKCVWLAPIIIKSKCEIDIEHFPFDSQKCILKFGSWTFDGNKLDIQSEGKTADLSKYTHHVEWKLVSMTAKRNVVKYVCCDEPYPDVTYTIKMKRRSLFYLINLIAPLVILTFLTCMTFVVPFESGERVALSITVLLSMTVFMLLVQNMIPSTSDTIPLIGRFYTAASVEIALAVIISCINLRLFYTNPAFYVIPLWMKELISGKSSHWLGVHYSVTHSHDYMISKLRNMSTAHQDIESELLFVKKSYEHRQCLCNAQYIRRNHQHKLSTKTACCNLHENDEVYCVHCNEVDDVHNSYCCQNSKGKLIERLYKISKHLKKLLEYEENSERVNREQVEWRRIAMALDKICFYTFLFLFATTTVVVFSRAPGYVP